MSWVWAVLILLAAVVVGVLKLRDARQRVDDAIRDVPDTETEISDLEACWRLPEHERKQS